MDETRPEKPPIPTPKSYKAGIVCCFGTIPGFFVFFVVGILLGGVYEAVTGNSVGGFHEGLAWGLVTTLIVNFLLYVCGLLLLIVSLRRLKEPNPKK